MDILQVQDRLKNFSQDQLIGEMQAPTGNAPQFLVLSEIMRRKRLQDDFAAQQGKAGSESTVAQEAVAAAGVPQGGIADMARSMAPSTDMTENTGVQAMASGGTVKKMAEGDIVVRGGVRYIEQADKTYLSEDGTRTMMTPGQEISRDFYNIPSRLGSLFGNASAGLADEANATLMDQYRASQGRTAATMRAGPDTSYQYPEVPIVDVSEMDRVGSALEGRAGPQTGLPTASEQYIANQKAAMDAAQPRFPPEAFNPMSVYGMRAGPDTSYQYPPVPSVDVTEMDRAARADEAYGMRAGPMTALAPEYVDPGPGPMDVQMERAALIDAASTRAGPMTAMREPAPAGPMRPPVSLDRAAASRNARAQGGDDLLSRAVDNTLELLGGRTNEEQAAIDAQAQAAIDARITAQEAASSRAGPQTGLAAAAAAAGEGAQGTGEAPVGPTAEQPAGPQGGIGISSGGSGGGGGGGSGIAGAASGMTSYEQELMDALARREKAATQDKWLALAQVGLNLMSSDQPTLGGAIGEAGLAGVQAAQGSRDQYEKDRLALTGALEESRMARAQAAAAAAKGAGGGGGGISDPYEISAGQGRLLTQVNADITRLDTMLNDPMLMGRELTPEQEMAIADAAAQRDQLVRYRQKLLYGAPLESAEPDETTGNVADE